MKVIILTLVFIISFTLFAFCKDQSYQDLNNTLGMKASNISGYGIYYNRKLSDNYNLQIMGLAYYLYQKKAGRLHENFDYDFGFEIQRNLHISQSFRVYILAGSYYYFDDDYRDNNGKKVKDINNSFNMGVGLACEYYYKRIVVSIDLGYKYFEDNHKITVDDKQSYPELDRVTKIGAGIGFGFMF